MLHNLIFPLFLRHQKTRYDEYLYQIYNKKYIIPKDKQIFIYTWQFDLVIQRDLKYQQAFGKHLKKLREDRNWTQIDLSAVSRISEIQISKIETGEDGPNFQTIRALAIALGKHPAKLFDFEYDLKLNTDFSSRTKKKEKPGTTSWINQLVADNFFKGPKSVAEVIGRCESAYGANLGSAATSAALRKLVESKTLKRLPSPIKGKYLYQRK